MAPKRFGKLLDSFPFGNRSRSHRSGKRDVHDSTLACAEPATAVASNAPSGPALVAAEATAGEESAASGAEYHLHPELARKYMANIDRFRILVMGRANAGKTTILQRVCNTTDDPEITDGRGHRIESAVVRGTLERGHHDIEHELVFSSNPGFIFHDSCGFEAGSARQFDAMKSFVIDRAVTGTLKERIHAIWFCIPMTDYHRMVTAAEQQFFNECDTGHVPVIVLLTKTEALHDLAMEELSDDGLAVGEAKEKAADKERELLERWLAHIKQELAKCKFPPKAYVSVQKMHKEGADCTRLVECTTNAVNEEGLQRLLVSTQQSSVALCIEYAVKKTLIPKIEMGIRGRFLVNIKDLQRELLNWFPNNIDQELTRAREAWHREDARRRDAHQLWERDLEEERLWEALKEARERAERREAEAGDHLHELSSLAVVDNYDSISTLPQNSTFLGKFPTLQSMVRHAIACLLVFEHAYLLMQQGSGDWEETLPMAVNKYKSHNIQTTVSTSVKTAFEMHGNYGAALSETILKIIGDNKICM